jgi:hypothetical protein
MMAVHGWDCPASPKGERSTSVQDNLKEVGIRVAGI